MYWGNRGLSFPAVTERTTGYLGLPGAVAGDWIIVSNPLIIAGNPTYGQLQTGVVIAGNPTYGQLHAGWVIADNRELTYRGNRGLSFAAVTGEGCVIQVYPGYTPPILVRGWLGTRYIMLRWNK
jgi:hypothetical protein